jgi:hypothetical protein
MEYTIIWVDGADEDLRIETSGPIDIEGLNAAVEAALADSRWRPGLKILVDHTEATWHSLDPELVRRRAELIIGQADRIGEQRIAFVVGNRTDFGIARLLYAFLGEGDDRIRFQAEPFTSLAAGRAWLRDAP